MFSNNIYRIIDANLNRASEALRVIEDWTRFARNNSRVSEKLKNIRHYLNNAYSKINTLILSREAINDIGRNLENISSKNSIKDIIQANCKRLEQSLRILAEYGNLLNFDVKTIENFRYEIYSIEKDLIIDELYLRLQSSSLYLVTNRHGFNSDYEFLKVIEAAVNSGIDIIQLREKNESEKKILELAREINKLINKTNIIFIINDRVDIALAVEADGVHLGQDDLSVKEARKIVPSGFLIGLSTHSEAQGLEALKSGADYLGIGPVFSTPTKANYTPCGLEYVKWASKNLQEIPWFAIGGIDESNIDKVINAGAKRIAVVRAIMNSEDPSKTIKKLKEALTINKKTYAEVR